MTSPPVVMVMAAIILTLCSAPASAADPELVARGKYVFGAAGGCACHTPPDALGLNAGGMKFELLFGVVYSRNITPDPETGIGRWTDAQVTDAIRRGERPDGSRLFPIHPYEYFASIADDETRALVAYLKSVKPIKAPVPARSLKIPIPMIRKRRREAGRNAASTSPRGPPTAPNATRHGESAARRTRRNSSPAGPGRKEACRPTSRLTSTRGSAAGRRRRSRNSCERA